MDWIVKNALSRDTEREHLNKILAEIKARIDSGVQPSKPTPTYSTPNYSPGSGSSGGSTTPKPVKVTLTGDVTGEASGTSTISIATTLTNPGIQDAPVDGSAYWRLDGNWANVPAIVRALSGFDADGFLSWDSDDGSFIAREIEGTVDQISVSNGLGIDANPIISLSDLSDSGTGSFKLITRDTKGRLSGTTDGTTDDVPEGVINLYFTDERAQDAVGAAITAGSGDGVTLTYDDVGNKIDAANTDKGSVAVASHVAAADPHPQYLQSGDEAVQSVNGQTGAVSLGASDVGADPAGSAAAAQAYAVQRGNHTGTQLASTISDFAATVRSTLLTGLSTATNAAIAATDTALQALGKLQAQISNIISTYVPATRAISTTAPLTGGGDLSANLTLAISAATTSAAGSMSAADKSKLDSISAGASVSSVGLSLPAIFTVSGSPVTASGTLTGTLASQAQNLVWASPDGASGTPAFRALVSADIPALDWSKITTGTPTTLAGYGITDGYTDAQARSAVVIDSIADADTAHAPSRNAVFDALAGKEPAIPAGTGAQFLRGDKTFGNSLTGNRLGLDGSDAVEVSLDIGNEGGGTATLHYRYKKPVGGFAGDGQLLGGAGSRPWGGVDYVEHSTAAYHLIATENHSATARGSDFAILATPVGGDHTDRVYAARFNGDGDIINSLGQTARKINPLERGRGIEVLRMLGGVLNTAEITLASNAPATYQTLFRGYALDGILESMTATWANRGTGLALCGHDGAQLVGAKALVSLLSDDIWSSTSTPAKIVFETTTAGSTARTSRWQVMASGHFSPTTDNVYTLGSASLRPSEIFAAASTINTSDAREKTAPRDLTDDELAAAVELSRLPSIFQWLHAIEAKGDDARLHCSPTVQSVLAVMESHGLDPFRYGFVCYDEWPEQPEIREEWPEERDDDGNVIRDAGSEVTQEYRPAGNRYSLRPSELAHFVMRGLAHRQDEMERRLAALGG